MCWPSRFPEQSNGSSPIVIHAKSGKLTDSDYPSAVDNAAAQVAKEPFVASVVNPLTPQGARHSARIRPGIYVGDRVGEPGLPVDRSGTEVVNGADPAKAAGSDVRPVVSRVRRYRSPRPSRAS